jgi:hypothetical protein
LTAAAKSRISFAVVVGAIVLAPTALAAPTTPTATTTTAKTTTAKTTTASKKATAPMGATGKKCWNDLIRDWYDGRIDKTYPVHCYQDALKHLPQDVKTYSDAYDVISRALADATRGEKAVDPNQPVPPPAVAVTGTGKTTTTTPLPGTGPGTGNGGPSAGPIGTGLNSGDRGANGIPLPLLILGGLALLLVAAGAAGFLLRRYQSRGGPSTS